MTISALSSPPAHPSAPEDVVVRMLSSASPARERLLVVEGGIGSGRTHMLRSAAATARAAGCEVVEVRPDRGDAVIGASSLALFTTLIGRLQRVRDSSASPCDPGFLIVVDDWERFDVAARETLQALVTRLVDEVGAACLLATGDRRVLAGREGLRHRRTEPLDAEAARGFLRAHGGRRPLAVEARLLRIAEGNPLLLDVLGRAWADEDAPSPFPVYPRLEQAETRVLELLAPLSEECREALLLAAVAGAEFPEATGSSSGDGDRALVQAGILTAGGRAFRDPVVRAVVLSTASPRALRAARRRLAELPESAPHLRLLLAADDAAGPEERARLLRDAAEERLRAGRPQEALLLLAEARSSARDAALREELEARVAAVAAFTGDATALERVVERSQEDGRVPGSAVEAARLADALLRAGDVAGIRRAALRALAAPAGRGESPADAACEDGSGTPADRIAPHDVTADLLATVLHTACVLRGDPAWWRAALAVGEEHHLDPVLRLVEACVRPVPAEEWERRLLLAEDSAVTGDPWKAVALHLAWSLLEVSDERRDRLAGLLDGGEEADGLPGALALLRRGTTALDRGRLDDASADLDRASARADDLPAVRALVDATRARVHAVRGDRVRTLECAERATAWALRHGAASIARAADHALCSLDLGGGRFEEAHARSTSRAGGDPMELLDAAEAASRLRLPEHCAELAAAAAELAARPLAPRGRMLALAATAVLDPSGGAGALFERSLDPGSEEWPFERARVQLCHGEWLRRRMRPLEARTRFRQAAAGFAAVGAELWLARAQHELRAAGGAGEAPVAADLSEQERRVVSLAAAGLSNKQIAQQLFVSPRTVSGHLYRIFPKLGVTSRAGLRDALLSLEGAQSA
ncbi:LuxR C-terminal-related transcriptional regulator [Rathayibacter sp. VKM Ac-2801]|uniref:LuxR C-terminal-related transcriptional regulator n=1 Tax=Rathayibacter sp. VKM Ac-2801 TaxID=2609255 RepID=UPI00131FE6C7|nr:LuxR C-terminal-related transcriptional regulator [Rathayibacter sp. VKM Ac-2801]QHC71669.1 hypothetical protein GSU45_15610 [Rathayibacter sp. VKM Ac-2801]